MRETRERVVVALTGEPEGETLIRRAARIAARTGAGTCSLCTWPARTASPMPVPSLWIGSVSVDLSGDIDVHMVTHEASAGGRLRGDGPQESR